MPIKTMELIAELEKGKNYSQIAEVFGVSRERIRQICKNRKLSKLPRPEKEKTLRQIRKKAFTLKEEWYPLASIKFTRKRQNVKKENKWEWDLNFEDLYWPSHCPILGLELAYESSFDTKQENSVSFDRIDSTKGYIKGNVHIISWRANRIKNDGTAEEHYKIANYLDKMEP